MFFVHLFSATSHVGVPLGTGIYCFSATKCWDGDRHSALQLSGHPREEFKAFIDQQAETHTRKSRPLARDPRRQNLAKPLFKK
jgi:hypothetical protein